MLILLFAGFSMASGGAYPTRVNLIIPETVGHYLVVQVLNGKLRSPVVF